MGQMVEAVSRLRRALTRLEQAVDRERKGGENTRMPDGMREHLATLEQTLDETLATIDQIIDKTDQPES